MKNLVLGIIVLSSTMAFGRPLVQNLHCTSNAKSPAVKSFDLKNLGSKEVESTIRDASFMGASRGSNGTVLSVGFSNECDNSYELTFYVSDLEDLQNGERSEINGVLQYSQADYDDETVTVTCRSY